MNQRITTLLVELENAVAGADKPEGPSRSKVRTAPGLVVQLRAAIAKAQATHETELQKARPAISQMSAETLLREPAGRDILLRAMAQDPMRTELDLISLGARGAASVIGSEYDAAVHRGKVKPVQLDLYASET